MPLKTLPLKPNGHMIHCTNSVKVMEFDDPLWPPMLLDHLFECSYCGQYFAPRITDDAVYVDTPCQQTDGITTVVTLDVPSGKIVVTDDLRPVYSVDRHDLASSNSALGQAQYIEAMAAIGCAYGPVGNTCPGLYRTGGTSYIIACPEYDYEDNEKPSLPESDCIADICTDLWAYSIADHDDWKARGGDTDALGWSGSIVEIPAGTYQFTHHTGERGFDRDAPGTVIFAHIEKIA
ncbi:hypothetical protein [Streptomyces rochei]|uniref:hypothetical protein n=1 Tax=Streptomyces rochei TaxID=1928 RepID=UPI0036457CB6